MAGRKIFNEQDARRCLAAAKVARGTVADWAQTHGIDGRSLNAWRVNLARRGVPRTRALAPRLVELVPAAPASSASRYVLHVGGVELEVGDDFNEVGCHHRRDRDPLSPGSSETRVIHQLGVVGRA